MDTVTKQLEMNTDWQIFTPEIHLFWDWVRIWQALSQTVMEIDALFFSSGVFFICQKGTSLLCVQLYLVGLPSGHDHGDI